MDLGLTNTHTPNAITPRNRRRLVCVCALLLSWAAGAPTSATAGALPSVPATFAQFHQTANGSDANLFRYLNNFGGLGDAQLFTQPSGGNPGDAIDVVFNYLTVTGTLPVDLQGNQTATLKLTSSTTDTVASLVPGVIGDQQFLGNGGFSPNVLTITRSTPALEGTGSKEILLKMTFTAQLLGAFGSNPQLSGDTSIAFPTFPNYTVFYESDFLTFPGGQHSFSLTFSSWTPGLGLAGPFYANATAAGVGTFAASAIAVPEPGSFAQLSLGVIALAIPAWRRWRRKG